MNNVGVTFKGNRLIRPGARSFVDASGIAVAGSSAEKKIAIIGQAKGGVPGEYVEFNNYSEAARHLKSGEILAGAQLAWGAGAGNIGFVRINDGKQSEFEAGGLKLTSKMYSDDANKVEVSLSDGTFPGSKRLTIGYWVEGIREVYDNLGPLFTVKHVGSNEAASLSITAGADGYANMVELKLGATEPIKLSVGSGGQFKDVNRLIAELDSHPDIEAKIAGSYNKNIETKFLDVEELDLLGGEQTVTGFKGDLLNQLQDSQVVDVEFTGSTVPENFETGLMSGGADGEVPASWAANLDVLIGTGAYILVPMTSDEVIQNEIARFIDTQTNVEQNEMRAFYGGALGESIDEIVNRSASMNSSRSVVCYPGIKQLFDGDNEPRVVPSYYTAALVAGRVAGLEMGEPATYKSVSVLDLERPMSTAEMDRLIAGGVTVVENMRSKNRSGFRVAQCVTTYRDELNPAYREESINEMIDFLTAELRESLEDRFVGTRGTAFTASVVKNAVQSFLDQKVRDEWLVEYQPESVIVEQDGEVVYVNYSAMPAHSINYILITSKFYKTTITA